jgi:hypothetical protein
MEPANSEREGSALALHNSELTFASSMNQRHS